MATRRDQPKSQVEASFCRVSDRVTLPGDNLRPGSRAIYDLSMLRLLVLFALSLQTGLVPTDLERVRVGVEAPDFSLPDQNGDAVRLSQFRGVKKVALVFYRGHW